MSKFIVIEPEEIEKARHLYEDTSLPIIDIAISLGLSQTTFLNRTKLWGWKSRRERFAALDKAAKKESEATQEIREIAAPAKKTLEKMSLLARVRSAVESEIVAIENVFSRVEAAHLRSSDAERAARTLATLVRTLKELTALEKPDAKTGEEAETQSSDEFRDLDEFRRKLAERLDRLRASGEA